MEEFRAAFVGRSTCFVPYPDEIAPGSVLDVDISIGDDAHLEIRGTVVGPDFDESGNVGVGLSLDAPSQDVVAQFEARSREGQMPQDMFSTSRMNLQAVVPATLELATPGDVREPRLAAGALIAGRYKVEHHVATGGMGDVYRAEHVNLKRPVALKLLRRELSADPEAWTRFEREAQLVSQLESEHVVRVFDFGRTDEGQLFLAMEFVEGETLDVVLAQGPLPPGRAVDLLAQVLDGLAEAHNLGVVHRDLKPPNIVLGRRRDGADRAKILDFGIAKLSDKTGAGKTRLTQVGMVVGTPAYLAPEQALADELDHRTDIYAMGCVAYECLTGRPPFIEGDLRKVISAHLTAAPQPVQVLRPDLARFPALCAAVIKAMSKEKENRFQSVSEFRDALRAGVARMTPVPLQQVAPAESWDAGADGWQPVASPTPFPPPVASPAPVLPPATGADDFFAATGARSMPPPSASSAALADAYDDAPLPPAEGVAVRVEVLGPPPRSEAATACAASVAAVMAELGGFVAGRDEEGVTFGFGSEGGQAAGRAAQSIMAAREALMVAGAELKVSAALRAVVFPASFPLPKDHAEAGRAVLARARANSALLDQRLSGFVGRVCEVMAAEQKGYLTLGARRLRKRAAPELIGRKSIIDALERRIDSLQQGVVASLFVTGPAGSGHTTLAQLTAAAAKKRGALALLTSGLEQPHGALVELLCAGLLVEVHERSTKLQPALEALPISPGARQAALVLAGVAPSPQLLTAGQAAYAVRVVLRAASLDKPLVIICDGLQGLDRHSREALLLMAERPVSKELLIAFSTTEALEGNQANVAVLALPPLSPAETQRLVTVSLGAAPGVSLMRAVNEASEGSPGVALEWVTWFDERGALGPDANGALELLEPALRASGELLDSVVASLSALARQVLLTAACLEERFDWAAVRELLPQADTQLPTLQVAGLVAPSGKRWRLRSAALRASLAAQRSAEAQVARRRVVEWMIARGKTNPASVDPLHFAQVLNQLGDGVRAAPVWTHLVGVASQRRDLRLGRQAWEGLAQAMGAMPQPEQHARSRVDALARAALQALAQEETAEARRLLTLAAALAGAVQPPSPEYLLAEARTLRLEGRRVRSVEVLAQAEALAGATPLGPLIASEQGESRELEGDLPGALRAFELARQRAAEARDIGAWHGEVALGARLEARLATLFFAQRDASRARAMLESSLAQWKGMNWPFAEARVLSTLGTVFAFLQQFNEAAAAYEAAGTTAARAGDLQFQARALLQQARAIRRVQGASAAMRAVASEARKLAFSLGWEQGRVDATALIEGR